MRAPRAPRQSRAENRLMGKFAFRVASEKDIHSLVDLRESKKLEINQKSFSGKIEEYSDSVRRYILENLSAGSVILFVLEHWNKIVAMARLILYTNIAPRSYATW